MKITRNRKLIFLVFMMTCVASVTAGVTNILLYRKSLEYSEERLVAAAEVHARTIALIMGNQLREEHEPRGGSPSIPPKLLPAYLLKVYRDFHGNGRTGEFIVARVENGKPIALRGQGDASTVESLPVHPALHPAILETVRTRQTRQERIVLHGKEHLAAFVSAGASGNTVVAMMEVAEIRQPFVETAIVTAIVTLAAIFAGSVFFLRITGPAVRQIEMSESKFRGLFRAANDAIFILDPTSGRFSDFNEQAASLSGYSPKELAFLTIADLDGSSWYKGDTSLLERMTEKVSATFERTLRRKDGSVIDVEISSRTVEHEGKEYSHWFIRDISERKKTMRGLEKNYLLLKTVFDSLPLQLTVKNDLGQYVIVNRSWRDFYELSSEQVIGRTVIQLKSRPLKDRKQIILEEKQVYGKGAEKTVTEVARNSGRNEQRFFRIMRIPIRDGHGRVEGLVSCGLDITEQQENISALRESEEWNRTISSSVNDAIIMTNDQGRVMFWNPAAENIFGWKTEEINGLKLNETIIPPEFHDRHEHGFEHFLADKILSHSMDSVELIGLKKDGKRFPIELSLAAVKYRKNFYAISVIRDITQRKKTEAERDRLNAAVDQTAETIILTDANGTIQYVNPAAKALGFHREDFLGCSPDAFIKIGEGRRSFAEVAEASHTKGGWSGKMSISTNSGSMEEVISTINPILDDAGRITGYVMVARDISREVQLENLLRTSQKMESLGMFSSGIAHDLNNSLGVINMNSEIVLDDLEPGHENRYNLELIRKATHRAIGLVEQILAYSRSRKQEHKPLNLHRVVEEAVMLIQTLTPETIELAAEPDAKSALVLGDITQIYQVVINLCSNALDAMSGKRETLRITLAVEHLAHTIQTLCNPIGPGSYLTLVVKDTGSGMDVLTRERIFEPFFTTKGSEKGTGMGLAVVDEIVRNHQGGIRVVSEFGQGSTFEVFLPISNGNEEIQQEEQATTGRTGTGNILLVEDRKETRDTFKSLFERMGYHISAWTSANDALQFFKDHPEDFDLVVTDQVMPELSGTELSRELTLIRPDLPVILMSGYIENIPLSVIKEAGVREVLKKTINLNQWAEVIGRTLET